MKLATKLALPLAAALCLSLFAPASHASGVGGYLGVGTGSFDFDVDVDGGGTGTADGSATGLAVGFAFDTNCARANLINYRLNAGFESVAINPDDSGEDESFGYLGIDNYLGFGLVASEDMRLWIGPVARIGYAWGTGDGMTDDASAVVFGLGAAIGLNYHLGQDYDISFVAGGRNDWYNGDFNAADGTEGSFDGTTTTGFFNVSFLWRSLDDKYGAK